jgi:hypothetical protein
MMMIGTIEETPEIDQQLENNIDRRLTRGTIGTTRTTLSTRIMVIIIDMDSNPRPPVTPLTTTTKTGVEAAIEIWNWKSHRMNNNIQGKYRCVYELSVSQSVYIDYIYMIAD